MGILEEYSERKDWQTEIITLERRVLEGDPLKLTDLTRIGVQLYSSPLLLKEYGKQLFFKGELRKAKEMLSLALKGLASQTFQAQVLSTFAYLAMSNLRMGELYEAETILLFLREEYYRGQDLLQGEGFLALALGTQLVEMDVKAQVLFEQAVKLYDSEGEYRQGSFALLEMLLFCGWKMTERELEKCQAFMHQRVLQDKAELVDFQFFCGFIARVKKNWSKVKYYFSLARNGRSVDKYTGLANILYYHSIVSLMSSEQMRGTIQTKDSLASINLTELEEQMSALPDDLELTFAFIQLKFELAYLQHDQALCWQLIHKAQAIQRVSLLCSQAELISKMKAQLEVIPQKHTVLRIACFGGLRFDSSGVEITHLHWQRKKAQELFVYLLFQPQYAATREQVAEALFEGLEPRKMANQLYVVTHQLKKVLNEQISFKINISTQNGVLKLFIQHLEYVDIEQYQALIKVGNRLWFQDRQLAVELYEKAYQLYAPLVPELQYVEWLDRLREQIEEKQVDMLKKLGIYAWECANYEQAESYFREWIELIPLAEEAYQQLLRLLTQRKKRAEAMSLYSMLEQKLREELDTSPSIESQQLVFGVRE